MERRFHIRKQISEIAGKRVHATDNHIVEAAPCVIRSDEPGRFLEPPPRPVAFDSAAASLSACLEGGNRPVRNCKPEARRTLLRGFRLRQNLEDKRGRCPFAAGFKP